MTHPSQPAPMPMPSQPVPVPTPAAPAPMPVGGGYQPQLVPAPAAAPSAVPNSNLQPMPMGHGQAGAVPAGMFQPAAAPQYPAQMPVGAVQPVPHDPTAVAQQPLTQAPTEPLAMPDIPMIDPDGPREEGERALPQISVHAFCDRNETAACINDMTRDWRMRRTNTKIYMGGLAAAIEFYHKETTPSLILIETGMRGPELFNQLEQLASVCDSGTKVVIIGAANDIRLYRKLMEKGVSDYIVPPLDPLGMIRSLTELYVDPESPFTGRAVAFFGAKGGVGSSTLAHNLAWVIAERLGQETSMIDLDSSWGTTALDFAYDSASGLEEALAEPDRLDETLLDRIMVRHTQKLSILPTSSSLNTKPVFDPEAYDAIVGAVRSISPLALLDVPHVWSEWTTNVLTTVDDVVITAVPDLANLRNTKNLVDFLKSQRPNDAEPILVINQTGRCKSKEDEISVENFAGAIGLEPSLVIGFDPDTFNKACNEGKMLAEMKSMETLVSGFEYLAARLRTGEFPSSVAPATGKGARSKLSKASKAKSESGSKSLFAGLFKKKG